MRILVAGRNAKTLAKTAGTFSNDLTIYTAATQADCFNLLRQITFDLIIACEKLADGSGLEVLRHVAVNTPNTLRIFAARPATLILLKGELGLFGLYRTLPYPINFRKLWAAISLARSTVTEDAPAARASTGAGAAKTPAPTPSVQQPLAHATRATAPAQRPPAAAATSTPTRGRPQPASEITSGMRAAARYAAAHAHSAWDLPRDAAAQQQPRIPESDAFKRARARRRAAQHQPAQHRPAEREPSRREPVMRSDSLAELARLAATGRPTPIFRKLPAIGKKRAALFVGSGVFAATTLAILTFVMVNANNSAKPSKLPMLASINQPLSRKVFPWQPGTQQHTNQGTSLRSEASASTVADLEVEAEAASESSDGDPDHLGPPPPDGPPPPPPSEPPSLESPAPPVDK